MARITKEADGSECRIEYCPAEDWMYDLYGKYPDDIPCDNCPFTNFINKLAHYEDLEEKENERS